ncbi:MAG: hypothetical protein GFH27_549333n62 [Chloroflexi bacterium AL-W]|nr:hypothetical protein [Chloroflexi bacterium AL-N1]NOK70485.1 hypothetical protein [Chloroflexi bacterium AL-N10]NOK78156.1 hypothetical protein [Chloroflexi bacterium AL-N5]NOK85255.1 hypothetical protein [Chloroflexi bacterium AL-W]NOK92020.1 hypothetical protein [Chloroflexi bacterium AL-N15]
MRSIILALFLFAFGAIQVEGTSHVFAASPPESGVRLAEPMVQPIVEPPQEPPLLQGEAAPVLADEMPMRTYSIDFYRLRGGLSAETIQAIAMPIEETIISGTEKMGNTLQGRVSIRFEPPQTGACAIRGLTLSNDRTMRLFYEPEVDTNRVINILAHEFIHQLQHDYYGAADHLQSDNILLEGMAVWASSAYFVDAEGRPLYHVRARQALVDGNLLPLATDLVADCRTTTRVNIYDQWGSFVEYLITVYGREQFDAVYRDSTGRAAGSANYQGVYDKSLAQLEAEWIEWLWNTP